MKRNIRDLRNCGPVSLGLILLAGAAAAQEPVASSNQVDASPWSVEASVGMEYDDNLNVAELDVSSGEGDVAAIIEVSVGYEFPGLTDYELEAGYDFYQSLYQDFSEFNLQTHALHLSGSREFGDLDAGLTYRYTYSRLDDNDFLRIHSLQPSLGYSVQPNWYLNLAYGYQDKEFADDAERDARQHALSLDNYIVFDDNKSYVRLGYRGEDEDADGPRYDYLGHYLNAGLSTPLNLLPKPAKLDFSYQYLTKDYSNITPSIGKERNDHRHTFGVKAHIDLSDAVFARLGYEYVDASSNLPSADFHENIVSVSLGGRW